MPKKLSINYVEEFVKNELNGECELISREYVNNTTPLLFKCKCGKTFKRTFAKLKLGRVKCDDCVKKNTSKALRMDIDTVISIINSKKCKYISGDYKNNNSKLTLQCECGNLFLKDLNHFNRGQTTCSKCSMANLSKSKMRSDEEIQNIIGISNYTFLGREKGKLKVKCDKGHINYITIHGFLRGNNNSCCKICANENLKGENHYNYKGGESEVLDTLRKSLKQWKFEVLKRDDFKCALTGKSNDLVVHHLRSFSNILKDCLDELNLEMKRKICEFETGEYEKLKQLLLEKHKIDNGITLNKEVHNLFHKIYGKGNNTIYQFSEFKKEYANFPR